MVSIFENDCGAQWMDTRKPFHGLPTNPLIYLPVLFGTVAVVVPLWALFVLPVFLVYLIIDVIPCTVPSLFQTVEASEITPSGDVTAVPNLSPVTDREFDIVVYGVTGHSGLLLAEYLFVKYGKDEKLKIALAGRNQKKLEEARKTLANNSDYSALSLPLIIADSSNDDSLIAMCKRTRVVGTTVGPFLKYGESLVRACARTGTSYCDLTGEDVFAIKMNTSYNKLASSTGARIVSFTGFDSVPSDIGTALAVKKYKQEFNEAPDHIDVVVKSVSGELQGGTLDTIVNLLENGMPPRIVNTKGKKEASKSTFKTTMTMPFIYYNKFAKVWTVPFFMATVNTSVVTMSNAKKEMADNLTYNEVMAMPNFLSVLEACFLGMVGGSLFLIRPVRNYLKENGYLPNPGQGPSRLRMEKGFTECEIFASGSDGSKSTSVKWRAAGDPGGKATAYYQGECAAALVLNYDELPQKDYSTGAGLTPAMAIGDEILKKRLCSNGSVIIE